MRKILAVFSLLVLAATVDAGHRGGRLGRLLSAPRAIVHRVIHPLEGIRERRAGACASGACETPAVPPKTTTKETPKKLP